MNLSFTIWQWDFQAPPIMGPSYGKLPILFPYHFHIFQDSYGIVWEAYHKGVPLLGVPGITVEFVVDFFKSTPRTKLGGPSKFEVVTRHIDRFMGMFGGTPPNHIRNFKRDERTGRNSCSFGFFGRQMMNKTNYAKPFLPRLPGNIAEMEYNAPPNFKSIEQFDTSRTCLHYRAYMCQGLNSLYWGWSSHL